MNKIKILGGILLIAGGILIFIIDDSEYGWIVNSLIGAVTAAGFFLTVFGTFNFKIKV